MRRLALLSPLMLLSAGCGGPPTIDDIADRWPEQVDGMAPVKASTNDHYTKQFFGDANGVDEVQFFQLDEASAGLGPLDVVVLRSEEGLTPEEVNHLRCSFFASSGALTFTGDDEYAGEDGLHGLDGFFSVNVDGVAVLVSSTLSDDQVHDVARALGGEDESEEANCMEPDPPTMGG